MAAKIRGSVLTLGRRAQNSQQVAHGILLQACREVVDSARSRWPRESGRSAALLQVHDLRAFVAVIGGAEYTLRIVSDGVRPWQDYVALPLSLRMRRVNEEIGKGLMALLEQGA